MTKTNNEYDEKTENLLFELTKATKDCRETRLKSEAGILE